jgi:hypothetical protein
MKIDWENTPQYCEVCDHQMRAPRTSLADHPGTRAYGGRGICNSCYRRKRRGQAGAAKTYMDWSEVHYCSRCGVRMRPPRTGISEFPETRLYSGNGVCALCAKGSRKVGPTVAELAAQGHPCIEPCPLPSNKRSSIW